MPVNTINNKLNKKAKRYLIALVIALVLCASYTIWAAFFRGTPPVEVKQEFMTLNNFNNYTSPKNYTIVSDELTIDKSDNNFVMKPSPQIDIQNIKNGALKLGLSNEAENESLGLTVWTKPGVNNALGDRVMFDTRKQILRVNYANGINSENLDSDKAYDFLTDFFGLPKHEVTIVKNFKVGGANSVSYQVKLFGRPVFFNLADPNFSEVGIKDGKVVQFFIYLLPKDFSRGFELKSLSKVSKENISGLYAQANFKPDNPTGGSEFGSEFLFASPATVGFREYKHGYIYFRDSVLGPVLIPTINISGVYTDANGERGEAILIVVNQELP